MELKGLVKIFKALASEQRIKCLRIIRDMELEGGQGAVKAFTQCCEDLQISPSTVSHHIKELENAGIIKTTRKGQCVCCQLNYEVWEKIRPLL